MHCLAGQRLIASVIDASQFPDGMTVAPGVSDALDDLKAQYWALPDLLTRVRWCLSIAL